MKIIQLTMVEVARLYAMLPNAYDHMRKRGTDFPYILIHLDQMEFDKQMMLIANDVPCHKRNVHFHEIAFKVDVSKREPIWRPSSHEIVIKN